MELNSQEKKKYKEKLMGCLIAFDELCNKNGLNYFAAYGTAIGAVRHNGFIPWDDDIDLYMPREDYKRLLQLKLYSPYQIYDETIEGYNQPYIKFVDCSTSLLDVPDRKVVLGVFIDVFPLDFAPNKYDECVRLKRDFTKWYWKSIDVEMKAATWYGLWKSRYRKHYLRIVYNTLLNKFYYYAHAEKVAEKYDRIKNLISKYTTASEYIISYCGPYKEREIYKSEWFSCFDYVAFENTKIRLCSGFDFYLHHLYGEYMQYPPEKDRVEHHAYYYLNLDKRMTLEEIKSEIDMNKENYDNIDWRNIGV